MLIENHDSRIPYYELILEKNATEPIYEVPLPDGFRYVLYQPGDEDAWIEIELSAKEFEKHVHARKAFHRYFGGNEKELCSRMVFVVSPEGEKVATATAWWDIRSPQSASNGVLSWVAVKQQWQNFKLSKPLITHVMKLMCALGAERIVVPTQTTTWVACRVYMDLGFRPVPMNLEKSRKGWMIMKRLTGHPALSGVESAPLADVFPGVFLLSKGEQQEHSCGAVVFGFTPNRTLCFLLVESAGGVWGFPKGHVESGEADEETAIREVREETGLSISFIKGFQRDTVYMAGTIGKRVTYFLAQADPNEVPHVQDENEIQKAGWYPKEEARSLLGTCDRRDVLEEAIRYLRSHGLI